MQQTDDSVWFRFVLPSKSPHYSVKQVFSQLCRGHVLSNRDLPLNGKLAKFLFAIRSFAAVITIPCVRVP